MRKQHPIAIVIYAAWVIAWFIAVGCTQMIAKPFVMPVDEPQFPGDVGVWVQWETEF